MVIRDTINWVYLFIYSWKNIMFSAGVTAVAVVLHNALGLDSWQIPMAIIATLGTALAIILGFRNGSAYDRWWEARKIWGGVVNDSRTWTREVLSMLTLREASDQDPEQLRVAQFRLIHGHIAFINAVRLQLRQVQDPEKWEDSVYRHLSAITRNEIENKSNKATQLLIDQGQALNEYFERGYLDDFRHMQLDNTLTRFSDYQGKAERIKNTPLPKAYELFNRILLDLFIFCLPFALLPIFTGVKAWWLVFPVTIIIGWVFYVIHRVGVIISNPFENDRWDVALDSICNTIEIDMLEAIESGNIPEKLQPEDGIIM